MDNFYEDLDSKIKHDKPDDGRAIRMVKDLFIGNGLETENLTTLERAKEKISNNVFKNYYYEPVPSLKIIYEFNNKLETDLNVGFYGFQAKLFFCILMWTIQNQNDLLAIRLVTIINDDIKENIIIWEKFLQQIGLFISIINNPLNSDKSKINKTKLPKENTILIKIVLQKEFEALNKELLIISNIISRPKSYITEEDHLHFPMFITLFYDIAFALFQNKFLEHEDRIIDISKQKK